MAAEGLLVRGHVLDDAFPAHDLEVRERDRALHGVAAERDPVGEGGAQLLDERRGDALAAITAPIEAYADVRPLAQVIRSGLDVVALAREPLAEPAEAADHLVGGEQDPVAVADLPDAAGSSRRAA